MRGLLDPGIRASYVQGCPIELFSAMASGLGGLPMTVDSFAGTFGAAVSTADVGNVFYAGSRRSFNTGYAKWTTPRVIQTQLLQLDAGIAAFCVQSDTHSIEAKFDSSTGEWLGLVDGVLATTIATGFLDDVVTFRLSGDVAEVKVNNTVMASSAGLFLGESVRLLMSWDTTGAVDGDAIAGQVIGGVAGDAIGYAEEGDADWCGGILNIVSFEEVAPGSFTALAQPTFMERRSHVEMLEESVSETAPGTFTASASPSFMERKTITEVLQESVSETAPGTFTASSTVTFIERRVVTS